MLLLMLWQLQAPTPLGLPPPPQIVYIATAWTAKDWAYLIGAVSAALLSFWASVRAGRAEARAGSAETAARSADTAAKSADKTCSVTHAAVADTRATVEASSNHISAIEANTNGRLTLMQAAIDAQIEEKRLLVAEMVKLSVKRLEEVTGEKEALAKELAAAHADILKRADAAPAVPPLTRAVREGDLVNGR